MEGREIFGGGCRESETVERRPRFLVGGVMAIVGKDRDRAV